MSFTSFMALCILGCDFLIYVLYQWAFGERRRTLMRRTASRRRAEALRNPQDRPTAPAQKSSATKAVMVMDPNRRRRASSVEGSNRYNEELAYRRVAASFAQLKPRT
jgi:hypothetical protein